MTVRQVPHEEGGREEGGREGERERERVPQCASLNHQFRKVQAPRGPSRVIHSIRACERKQMFG